MRPVKLHVVRYFKGEESRWISKHLNREHALQMAQRFIDNLLQKQSALQEGAELTILTHDEGDVTTHRLQNNTTHSVSDEGVVVRVETQTQSDWDYPLYTPSV